VGYISRVAQQQNTCINKDDTKLLSAALMHYFVVNVNDVVTGRYITF
jgi:hypothetical protein